MRGMSLMDSMGLGSTRSAGPGISRLTAEAADRPPERAEYLPEPHAFGVDADARHGLVAREQVFARAEPAHGGLAAEPPGVGADPAEIPHRIADVRELPVEHCVHAVRRHHEVAVAEVVVHQLHVRGVGQVVHQPAGRVVNHRLWGIQGLIALPGLVDESLGSDLVQVRAQARGIEIDGVNAGEDLAALVGESRAQVLELGQPVDAGTQGLAVEPLHDEARAEAVVRSQHVVDLRLGHSGLLRTAHQHGLDLDAGKALLLRGRDAARRAAHGEPALTVGDAYLDPVGLLAGASGQALRRAELLEAIDVSLEHPGQLGLEVGACVAHRATPEPPSEPVAS
jgi:hypothetical protein